MQNVVVDTNILVRALLKQKSSDGAVIRLIIDKKVQFWYSRTLIGELLEVLSYPRLAKYGIKKEAVEAFIKVLLALGKEIIPQSVQLCRDPDDNEILGIALAIGGTVFLVSADKDILSLKRKVKRVTIVTPQEFLKKSLPN